jgi:hypothetical protein
MIYHYQQPQKKNKLLALMPSKKTVYKSIIIFILLSLLIPTALFKETQISTCHKYGTQRFKTKNVLTFWFLIPNIHYTSTRIVPGKNRYNKHQWSDETITSLEGKKILGGKPRVILYILIVFLLLIKNIIRFSVFTFKHKHLRKIAIILSALIAVVFLAYYLTDFNKKTPAENLARNSNKAINPSKSKGINELIKSFPIDQLIEKLQNYESSEHIDKLLDDYSDR